MKKITTSFALLFIINTVFADDLSFVVTNTTTGAKTGSIDLSLNGGVSPYSYKWQGPSGFTATTQDITSLGEGTYTVTVTDNYCGIATATVQVTAGSIGIQDVNNNLFSFFPNPTTGELTLVSTAFLNKASVQVLNVLGETVLEKNDYSGGSLSLNISELPKGTYIIELLNQGTYSRKKVLKD